MEQMNFSISTLNGVIAQKLKSLASVTSAKDIKEINSFLRESQRLRKTLYSIGDFTEEEEYESNEGSYVEETEDLDYMGILIQICEYVKNFHAVVDFKKVKETKSQWLLDESAELLSELRKMFGSRIPVIPGSIEGRQEDVVCANDEGDETKEKQPKKRK
jgi:hypothetical protein